MKFQELPKIVVEENNYIAVVVKNEHYLDSLQLLRNDIVHWQYRTVFFPVENVTLFDDTPSADVLIYHPELLSNATGYNYGAALLNSPRMRPRFVLTEYTDNPRSLRSGTLFGVHLDASDPITEENSMYPVDSMIRCVGMHSFALPVENKNIEEGIRSLHNIVQENVHPLLFQNLKYAYMDGKRWKITPENISQALAG